jgi:hypothetical protein
MTFKPVLRRTLFVTALGVLLSAGASAAALTIDGMFLINDLTDVVSITDITPGGPTGRLNACAAVAETCSFNITSPFLLVLPGAFPGLNMTEQGTGLVSDTLAETDTGTSNSFWQFISDSETPLAGLGGSPNSFPEDGTAQLAAVLIYGTTGHADEIFVQSDVEGGGGGVPEPSTAGLMVLGFAGFGLVALRRRFAARAL